MHHNHIEPNGIIKIPPKGRRNIGTSKRKWADSAQNRLIICTFSKKVFFL